MAMLKLPNSPRKTKITINNRKENNYFGRQVNHIISHAISLRSLYLPSQSKVRKWCLHRFVCVLKMVVTVNLPDSPLQQNIKGHKILLYKPLKKK